MERPRIYRRKQLEYELSMSRSTIYSMMKKGQFPRPIQLSPGAVGWPVEAIEQWLQDRKNGDFLIRRYGDKDARDSRSKSQIEER